VKLPHAVLYDWKRQWENDRDWRPWKLQVHGEANRTFTDEQESELADTILTEYIAPGKQFVASTFRELAQRLYVSAGGNTDDFKCSDHFIHDFRKRHGFSSRRFHLRRRSRLGGRFDIEAWKEEIISLLHVCPHRRVINCDETSWKVVPNGLLTWAPVGADAVSVTLDAGDKASVTVLASVTAAHEKLPLFMIAKGSTTRAERSQLGRFEDHETDHSISGWTTVGTFRHYLSWLRTLYPDDQPIHLLLDCYSVHRANEIRPLAAELGIELHYIPAGWTDELQPLDRYVFGAMKAMCRRLFQRHCDRSEDGRVSRSDAIKFLVRIWELLEVRVIEKGWGVYEDADGDGMADDEWEPELSLDSEEESGNP
jgi:hypothetical protein